MLDSNPRLKLMLTKLKEQVDRNFIDNDWACTFVNDCHSRASKGGTFTVKQIDKLEELFERY
jgi:hypothetical protein